MYDVHIKPNTCNAFLLSRLKIIDEHTCKHVSTCHCLIINDQVLEILQHFKIFKLSYV